MEDAGFVTQAQSTFYVRVAMVTVSLLLCTISLLTFASTRASGGTLPYSSASVVLLVELVKFLVSLAALYRLRIPMTFNFRENVTFIVPGIIYVVDNNISFLILQHYDPSTMQVLSNVKVLFIAVFYRLLLKKVLFANQYISLLLLACGLVVCESGDNHKMPGQVVSSWTGFSMLMANNCLAAFADVYCEYALKSSTSSIHFQNLQLYSYGILFNSIAVITISRNQGGFFHGFSWITWAIVFLMSVLGICTSVIMKYSNNFYRVTCMSVSFLLATFVSMLLFGFKPRLDFHAGALVVVIAVYFYFHFEEATPPLHSHTHTHTHKDDGQPALLAADRAWHAAQPTEVEEMEEGVGDGGQEKVQAP